MSAEGAIHVGIGGWDFDPWRGTFYPLDLAKPKQLEYLGPRHESFKCPAFVAMARAANVAIVIAEHETYPQIADLSADFVYARLQCAREAEPEGYSSAALDRWAEVVRGWAAGDCPSGLDYV